MTKVPALDLEETISPLFDMWLSFEASFGDRAIDQLDISDQDAESMAKKMEGLGSAGAAFAYLLRSISQRRKFREICHVARVVWATTKEPAFLSLHEMYEHYMKLPKGKA